MRDRRAQLSIAELPLGAQPDHRLPLGRSDRRQGKRAHAKQSPSRMLQMQKCALAIRVKSRKVGERGPGVAETELTGRCREHYRRRRLVRAESRERVAGGEWRAVRIGPEQRPND